MNQETSSIQEEVQASAHINDHEEIIEVPLDFKPIFLQDEQTNDWEISVIRKDYMEMLLAQDENVPFGGGHPRKLILFGSNDYENKIPYKQEWIDWAMGVATSFAKDFNDGKFPFPEGQ